MVPNQDSKVRRPKHASTKKWFEVVLRLQLYEKLVPLLFALLLAVVIVGIILLAYGANPLEAYVVILRGSFGSLGAASETFVKAIPMALCGLGVTIAFKTSMFNIGAEGQLLMGAMGGTLIGTTFYGLPALLLFPVALAFSFLFGALWGAIPGVLRSKLDVNEIFVTLFMNYVAFYFVSYLVHGPWKDPTAFLPHSRILDPAVHLPIILPGTRLHAGMIILILLSALIYVLFSKTVLGYRILLVGSSSKVARFSGINIGKYIVIAMILSGGIAGLAGFSEVAGIHHRLRDDISPAGYYGLGYGYLGIAVALIGKLHPVGNLVASIFCAAIIVGSNSLQLKLGVPVWISYVVIAVMVITVLTSDLLVRKLKLFTEA